MTGKWHYLVAIIMLLVSGSISANAQSGIIYEVQGWLDSKAECESITGQTCLGHDPPHPATDHCGGADAWSYTIDDSQWPSWKLVGLYCRGSCATFAGASAGEVGFQGADTSGCVNGCQVDIQGSWIQAGGDTFGHGTYTGQSCTPSAAPDGGQCTTVNGQTVCGSGPNCGTVNGEQVCVDAMPAGQCTFLADGSYVCANPHGEKVPQLEPDPDDDPYTNNPRLPDAGMGSESNPTVDIDIWFPPNELGPKDENEVEDEACIGDGCEDDASQEPDEGDEGTGTRADDEPELPACPAGTGLDHGVCVADPVANCPAGFTRVDGVCSQDFAKACPQGSTVQPDGITCSRPAADDGQGGYECHSGGTLVGDQCISGATDTCPSGTTQTADGCTTDETELECPEGSELQGKVCVAKPQCENGQIWDGQVCKTPTTVTDSSCHSGQPPTCEGDDAAACLSLRYLWQMKCFQQQGLDKAVNLFESQTDTIVDTPVSVGSFDTSDTISGACPAPVSITLPWLTVEIPFDGLCQIAVWLAPLITGAAMLFGARIIIAGV